LWFFQWNLQQNMNQSNVRPEDQAALNGTTPDALIDARAMQMLTDFQVTKINGVASLVEAKGLSLQLQTFDARVKRIDADIELAATA
jgi:hypothetical protein